jgi:hypothetical protein
LICLRHTAAAPAISAILVLFSAAGLLLETAYRSNPHAERLLCGFHICATGRLIESARARRLDLEPAAAALGASEALLALRRDPASAARWSDAGESLLLARRPEPAAYAFRRAADLAPNSPPVLLQAANFYFRTGQPAAALPLTARILRLIREYDGVVFLAWSRCGVPLSDLIHLGLPDDAGAARALFEFTLSPGDPPLHSPEAAAAVWQFLRSHHYDTGTLAARYLDFLLSQHLYSAALAFWNSYVPRGSSTANLLFNGDFEASFTGARLDWLLSNSPHAAEQRDSSTAHSGAWSLRLEFDGIENLAYRGIAQTAVVSPGICRFRAWVKTRNVTTDRGIYFRIYDPESPARLDRHTPDLTGTADWTLVELTLVIPAGTNLVQVQICRDPSWKFDNKFSGTTWIDSLELSPDL